MSSFCRRKWGLCLLVVALIQLSAVEVSGFGNATPPRSDELSDQDRISLLPRIHFIGISGSEQWPVFRREIELAKEKLSEVYGLASHQLITCEANTEVCDAKLQLESALQRLKSRMSADDVLFLMISAHGTRHQGVLLTGHSGRREFLTPDALFALLSSGMEISLKRIILVSSCYSGSFIDKRYGPESILITSSASYRPAFGCADDQRYSYFADAFFNFGLSQSPNLVAAFNHAWEIVSKKELVEVLLPSLPQMVVGEQMTSEVALLEEISQCRGDLTR